jgi:hypothetical protein
MSVRLAFVPSAGTHFKEREMFPGPMEYLKSHAIAFVAGAVTVLVASAYVKVAKKLERS